MTRTPAGSIRTSHIGETVTVSGWVQRRRDHGGIAFVDIRDTSGVVQVVADPEAHEAVADLKMEYCISVTGVVRARPEAAEATSELLRRDLASGLDRVLGKRVR